MNKQIKFVQCPFARCLNMMKTGDVDLIMGIRKTPERSQYIEFLEKPFDTQSYPVRFFIHQDSQLKIDNYEDLNKLIIGTLRDVSYFDKFDNDTTLKKVEAVHYRHLIQLVLKGRIDTFPEREESITPWIKHDNSLNKLKLARFQSNKAVNSYMGLSKKSPLLKELAKFNNVQNHLLNSNQIAIIINKRH